MVMLADCEFEIAGHIAFVVHAYYVLDSNEVRSTRTHHMWEMRLFLLYHA